MINIKSIRPAYTKIVTTAEVYDKDSMVNGIIIKTEGKIKEYQKVVAVGAMVKNINVGDLVVINPTRYMKRKFSDNSLREEFVENPIVDINIPTVMLDGIPHFILDTGTDIEYVIEDYEEIPDETPKSKIIQPKPVNVNKSSIIL